MKAVLIIFDQAHYSQIERDLPKLNIRGFSSWKEVYGRGSNTGEPHYGSHAWPSVNNAIITIVENDRVPLLLKYLKELDNEYNNLGLRAFVLNVEDMV
ncbi:PG0541 family transporter-associated protein [uncultured Proteiniphilum sp.]|uniref:PG0541 family transporter-associated protein n=1 Tax=uncultured Proteiniphilum sp. TaxID=497637 RepID=UPI002607CD2A|nr:PG0541 family transporter-associated protein [uncultured Proteiniphilum sp.]